MFLSVLKLSNVIFLIQLPLQLSASVYCPAVNEVSLKNKEFLYDSEKMKDHQIESRRYRRPFLTPRATIV